MSSDSALKAPDATNEPKPWRRWIWLIAFLPGAATFGYRHLMTVTAEGRVRDACAELTPGMSMESIAKFADAHGMYPPDRYSDGYFIGDKITSNWYNCHLELQDGTLQSARYFDFGKRR